MRLRTIVVMSMLVAATSPALVAAQVRVGAVAGYSMREETDTSLTHGPLTDEVTVGRTWLLGAVVDGRLTDRNHLAFEFAYGPYDNDVDRYCIYRFMTNTCEPGQGVAVSRVFLYGAQYRRSFEIGAWRPYLGGGVGVKQYSYGVGGRSERGWISSTLSAAVGVESTHRLPISLELRGVFVRSHPIWLTAQIELQARLTVLLWGRAR